MQKFFSNAVILKIFCLRAPPNLAPALVALSRCGGEGEWREAQRVNIGLSASLSCALSDSRVPIGRLGSAYLELLRVQKGPQIARVHNISVTKEYLCFSATSDSADNTQVAMSYEKEQSVRVYRLVGDRLEEMGRIRLESPRLLLWVAARLFVSAPVYSVVVELELKGSRLERRCQLIGSTGNIIIVHKWCALDEGLVVYNDSSKELIHYSLTLQNE